MSPAGLSGSGSNIWGIGTAGDVGNGYVNYSSRLLPVLNLTANTQISDGDGTKETPFVIE